jgi:hypothetical protein
MYKIISITQNGVARTDGRYPLRIGCTGQIRRLMIGFSMWFQYDKDSNGNPKEGALQTSSVLDLWMADGRVYVTTVNSEYIFEAIN